ncbi:MAG: HAD family hydrolase [Bacillota bacterium]|nr:HAD family hydrolase [Bacillota bacterium]
MKAIGFDLGKTLITYEGVPLNWESLYEKALEAVLVRCGLKIDKERIVVGKQILSKYNTRINYREYEVSANQIFEEILDAWDLNNNYLSSSKAEFFSYFQQNSKLYEDTIATLQKLKELNIKIGILTDVPYGMDKNYVLKDIEQFKEYIDVVLTSVDVGYRKPHINGFTELSKCLGVSSSDMIFIGDEPKDIIGANKSEMFSVLINRTRDDINYGQRKTINSLTELLDIVK